MTLSFRFDLSSNILNEMFSKIGILFDNLFRPWRVHVFQHHVSEEISGQHLEGMKRSTKTLKYIQVHLHHSIEVTL